MKNLCRFLLCLLALVIVSGCASTKISDRHELVTERLPRPSHIWVHNFAASGDYVPADSIFAGRHSLHRTPLTAQQIALGRRLGAQIRVELVKQIRAMGLPAGQAAVGTRPRVNDILIRGYLLTVDEGDQLKRVAVGFGQGASELKVAAEGFQMTAHGLRRIGYGKADSGGSETPGAAMGAATLVATGNPAGLIIGTGAKMYAEETGSAKVEGRAKAIAEEIAEVLEERCREQGWID